VWQISSPVTLQEVMHTSSNRAAKTGTRRARTFNDASPELVFMHLTVEEGFQIHVQYLRQAEPKLVLCIWPSKKDSRTMCSTCIKLLLVLSRQSKAEMATEQAQSSETYKHGFYHLRSRKLTP
jgi:hypothetical protein